jgi:hypothetical protein
MDVPRVNFDFNQKFYVWLENAPGFSIPCLTHVDNKMTEIPNKSWITYKGLAELLGITYMRFHFKGEDVLLGFDCLKYLDEVPHRFPGEKVKLPKAKLKPKATGLKFLMQKTGKAQNRKPTGTRRRARGRK